MKLSVTTKGAYDEQEQFALFKKCGFDGCDLSLNYYFSKGGMFGDMDTLTDEQVRTHFTELRKRAEEEGCEIFHTHAEFIGHMSYYEDFEDIVKRQIASIKATHYLGVKYCVMHPLMTCGRVYDLKVKEAFDETEMLYRRLLPALEEYDVCLCLENLWLFDPAYRHICSTIFSHADELNAMCDKMGDRFKICVDVGHAILSQTDPVELLKQCGDRVVCLHLHENDGLSDLHTFPFSAHQVPPGLAWKPMEIDWEAIMKALCEINYKGVLNFEVGLGLPKQLQSAGLRYLAEIGRYLITLKGY